MSAYRDRAINEIIEVLRDCDALLPGTNMRPIAEAIYSRAGRNVMEGWKQDMDHP